MGNSTLIAAHAHQWGNCAGSALMQTRHGVSTNEPDETKEESKACRLLAVLMLQAYQDPDAPTLTKSLSVGTTMENGLIVTDEIFDLAHEYALDVLNYCTDEGALRGLHIEHQIALDHILTGMYDRIDCYAVDPGLGHLTVWSANFGYGVIEVFENWRLMMQASGILRELKERDVVTDFMVVTIKVVQPRASHRDGSIRDWTFMSADLRPHINMLHGKAHESQRDDAQCKSGAQCRKCTARHGCEVLQRTAYDAIDYIGVPVHATLSGPNLAYQLKILRRAKSVIESLLSGTEAQVESEIRAHKIVPGFRMDHGYGNLAWLKEFTIDDIAYLGSMDEENLVNMFAPKKLCTPTQAINKGIDEAVIKTYSSKPKTKMKLVEDDGSRARQAFTTLKPGN